jgi:tRNA-Thr(GGU) m(6)t(6)A37 methyltransferase TsaA
MKTIEFRQIGIIHSPFKSPEGTPIQPSGATGVEGKVEVFPDYQEGLEDLAGFSHIFLIYHFHLAKKMALKVKPFLDDQTHGIFATRAPTRPNPIGLSVVRLIRIDNGNLYIQDIDVVDKTPLLDIKPYVNDFDVREVDKIGWLESKSKKVTKTSADGRFTC